VAPKWVSAFFSFVTLRDVGNTQRGNSVIVAEAIKSGLQEVRGNNV
jgi:hypothetical protein